LGEGDLTAVKTIPSPIFQSLLFFPFKIKTNGSMDGLAIISCLGKKFTFDHQPTIDNLIDRHLGLDRVKTAFHKVDDSPGNSRNFQPLVRCNLCLGDPFGMVFDTTAPARAGAREGDMNTRGERI
jgi:hypothetical protein